MSCKALYEVEQIIGKKALNRRVLYRVRWKGFSPEHDSWEPSTNLGACRLLLKAYNDSHDKELDSPHSTDEKYSDTKRNYPFDETPSSLTKGPPAKKQKLSKNDKWKEKLTEPECVEQHETLKAKHSQSGGKVRKRGYNAKIKLLKEKAKVVKKIKFSSKSKAKSNDVEKSCEPPKLKTGYVKVKRVESSAGKKKIGAVKLKSDKAVVNADILKSSSDNTKYRIEQLKQLLEKKQTEMEKANQIVKQKGNTVVARQSRGKDKVNNGSKQTTATPQKTNQPAMVDLTTSPTSDSLYISSSESIEISDDDDEEDVLYSLNPDCDFNDDKQVSKNKTKGHKDSSADSGSASSKSSVIEIEDAKSQGVKESGKTGPGRKKKRMSLMDSKKKDKFWQDNSDELLRPVSPSPPFTTVKEPSGSPDNPDPSKPSGPDPVSPEASETYLAETYLADVPTSFSVTGGGAALGEDETLSPGSVSYKSFLDTLPDQLYHGHKGRKKGKVTNDSKEMSGFRVQEMMPAPSGIGAVERRTSVRASECAFRYKQIVVKKCFRFTQIWLNTHTVMKNALNPSVIQEIVSAMNSAKYDDSHLVLFAGFGPVFCSGTDLHYLVSGDRRLAARQMAERVRELTKTFITFPKPIIAAVSGAAVGLGVSLLLLCDVVYASDKASFHLPYSQLSQTPEGCSSFTLPQTLGLPSANELLFGGRKITAMEAYQLGLVSQVFWPTLMMQEVIPRAQNMAASSAKALEATKLLVRSHHRTKMELTNETECNLLMERWLSVDCQHAIESYIANEKNWAFL